MSLSISGNTFPEAGKPETYTIKELKNSFYDWMFPYPQPQLSTKGPLKEPEISWSIWILEHGVWKHTSGNDKKGKTVSYTFNEKSLTQKAVKIVVQREWYTAELIVRPQSALKPKIDKVELLDGAGNKTTKPLSYKDILTVKAHCTGMFGQNVFVTLWEDDVAGPGHSKANEINRINYWPFQAYVNAKGIAEVKIPLASQFLASVIANAHTAPGELTEGKTHEYYVTVECYGSKNKTASNNVNVENPSYKPPASDGHTLPHKPALHIPPKTTPATSKPPSKKQEKKINPQPEEVTDYHEEKIQVTAKADPPKQPDSGNSMQKVESGEVKQEQKIECVCKEYQFRWGNMLTCEQRKKVLKVCGDLWGEDLKKEKASQLMSVMHLETGKETFKPYADNGAGFSGLIQFSDQAAKSVGTTRTALKKMSFVEQMDYVKKYLEKKKDKLNTMADMYLMVLKPNAVGEGNNKDYVLFDESVSVPDVPFDKDNLYKEPWVTKYGYTSNPTFMKEKNEYQKRMHKTYTKGEQMRFGLPNGKTYVWEVEQELKDNHYNIGISHVFNGKCESVKEEEKEVSDKKAPWVEVALKEFERYKGLREIDSPLKEKISVYFDNSSAKGLGYNYSNPWCGAFLAWCFEQTADYKKINVKKSAAAFGWLSKNWPNGEDCKAFVGALIVFNFSHVALIVGENADGTKYVYLGGNQGNGEKRSGYQKIIMGSVSKKSKTILGITKPKDYQITDEDKKLPRYNINAENTKASSR